MSRSKTSFAFAKTPAENEGEIILPFPLPVEITNMREFMGMNQKELAKALKVSWYTIRLWELGESMIPPQQAQALRRLYDKKMGFDKIRR